VADPDLRWWRAAVVSILAWCIAATAHGLSGGSFPGLISVLAMVVLTGWPLAAALRSSVGGGRLAALMLLAQAAMHVGFQLAPGLEHAIHPGTGTDRAAVQQAGHHAVQHAGHHAVQHAGHAGANAGITAGAHAGAGPASGLVPDPRMVAGHVLAAIVVGLVVANGDRTLCTARRLLVDRAVPAVLGRLHRLPGWHGRLARTAARAAADVIAALRRRSHRDPRTGVGGEAVATYGYRDYPKLAKVVAQSIALHEGRRFGPATFWAAAAFCASVITSCVTGPVMWWRRRPRNGGLAAPRGRLPLARTWWLALPVAALAIALPVFGASLVAVLLLDLLLLRRVPRLRSFFAVAT
jgi:hypothetical protein